LREPKIGELAANKITKPCQRREATSTLMIERHYSHLIARTRSAILAGGRW